MDVNAQEKIDNILKGASNSVKTVTEIAYQQGYDRGAEVLHKKLEKSYNDGFAAGQKDAYEKANEAMLKVYLMNIEERRKCFGTPKNVYLVDLYDLINTLGIEDIIYLLKIYSGKEENTGKIKIGDVCEYTATIKEPFVYMGKVGDWHFALGRKTMEKYCFKGLTGIKKTGEHVTDITSILIKDKEEE